MLFERYLHAIALRILAFSRVSFLQYWNGMQSWWYVFVPHQKIDHQPKKMPKKGYYSHNRRGSDDTNAVAIVKIVPQLVASRKTRKHLFLKEKKQLWGNPMHKVLGSSCVKQVSWKRKDHRLEKYKSKISSAKSPRYEIWGPVPWRDW